MKIQTILILAIINSRSIKSLELIYNANNLTNWITYKYQDKGITALNVTYTCPNEFQNIQTVIAWNGAGLSLIDEINALTFQDCNCRFQYNINSKSMQINHLHFKNIAELELKPNKVSFIVNQHNQENSLILENIGNIDDIGENTIVGKIKEIHIINCNIKKISSDALNINKAHIFNFIGNMVDEFNTITLWNVNKFFIKYITFLNIIDNFINNNDNSTSEVVFECNKITIKKNKDKLYFPRTISIGSKYKYNFTVPNGSQAGFSFVECNNYKMIEGTDSQKIRKQDTRELRSDRNSETNS